MRPGEGEVIARRRGTQIVRYSDAQPTMQTEGDVDAMPMYAGLSVEHVREVAPAQLIARNIAHSLG